MMTREEYLRAEGFETEPEKLTGPEEEPTVTRIVESDGVIITYLSNGDRTYKAAPNHYRYR
jgi:hypothetical protein